MSSIPRIRWIWARIHGNVTNLEHNTHGVNINMARTVQCVKLGREAEGLDRLPYPGALGQRIFENVSKEAWQGWIKFQTMLVNENRLNLADIKARQYLAQQMENYFFGEGTQMPTGFVPPKN